MPEEFTHKKLTVIWDKDKCQWSEFCTRGLPQVFVPYTKPWIKLDQADPERIRLQVSRCPSGALRIKD